MLCNIWIPIKSQNWLKCTQNSHKMPTKTPPNAHKNAPKCTQWRRKNAHKNTYAQLMHHYNNVTLMCRYLKSCTTRLFSRQLFHVSWRPLLVLCIWSTVYRWMASNVRSWPSWNHHIETLLTLLAIPHGWPVMWEAFRCDDSIIINLHFPVRIWSKMAQAEIIPSAAILDGLVTKIADVLRTVFSSYFVDIKCSCLVKCHCGMPLVVQSKIRHHYCR